MYPAGGAEAGSLFHEEAPMEGTTTQAMTTMPTLRGLAARAERGKERKGQSQGRNETYLPHVEWEPVIKRDAIRSRPQFELH